MRYSYMESRIGRILLARDSRGLARIEYESSGERARPDPSWVEDDAAFADVRTQLGEYFDGQRREFTIKLAPQGTPFQLAVWRALLEIRYGTTSTYRAIAERIGRPNATRAVGTANGSNPLPIVIPCHRVIGSDGSLTGYGGGTRMKQTLLEIEGIRCTGHGAGSRVIAPGSRSSSRQLTVDM